MKDILRVFDKISIYMWNKKEQDLSIFMGCSRGLHFRFLFLLNVLFLSHFSRRYTNVIPEHLLLSSNDNFKSSNFFWVIKLDFRKKVSL